MFHFPFCFLISIYYAHPYQIGQGESVISLMRRFGLNVLELTKLNPRRTSYAEVRPS